MTKSIDHPREKSVVIFVAPKGYENSYPFPNGATMIYLGEIVNMPGHVIVVDKAGKVWWGYHTENFREATEDEV